MAQGVRWGKKAPGQGVSGGVMRPSAHQGPGYPSVGLLASRARLRFARRGKPTTAA